MNLLEFVVCTCASNNGADVCVGGKKLKISIVLYSVLNERLLLVSISLYFFF